MCNKLFVYPCIHQHTHTYLTSISDRSSSSPSMVHRLVGMPTPAPSPFCWALSPAWLLVTSSSSTSCEEEGGEERRREERGGGRRGGKGRGGEERRGEEKRGGGRRGEERRERTRAHKNGFSYMLLFYVYCNRGYRIVGNFKTLQTGEKKNFHRENFRRLLTGVAKECHAPKFHCENLATKPWKFPTIQYFINQASNHLRREMV